MSRDHDTRLYLEDMMNSASKVMRYTQGMDFERFVADEIVFDAVLRNLEIIGEAAKNVPEEVRAQHSEVEWRKIAGLRDVLTHAYFSLHQETLWDIVHNKVPQLSEAVRHILTADSGLD